MNYTFGHFVLFFFFLLPSFVFGQHFFPDRDLIVPFSEQLAQDELFSDGSGGGFSKFTAQTIQQYLKIQMDLQEELVGKKWFKDNKKEFIPLMEYGFGKKNETQENVFGVSDNYLKEGITQIQEINEGLTGKKTERVKALREAISALIDQLQNKGLDGLISGVLGGFTKEQRTKVLSKENIKDKIDALDGIASEIDDAAFGAKFDYSKHDLEGKPESFKSIVEILQYRTTLVDTLMNHLLLMYMIDDSQDIDKANIEESFNKVFSLAKNDRAELLNKLQVNLNTKSGASLFSWFQRSNFEKGKRTKTSTNYKASHVLAEVPSYIGIFRGCFGRDCSTSYSWPYPNSPFEKVFFPVSKGRVAGYISTTLVEMEGKRMIMIKDLQGPNISPEMADDILQFLHFKYAPLVKAEGLALTNAGFITGQNNYPILREFLTNQIATHKPEVPVKFYDTDARALFRQKANGGYDDPNRHQTASYYVPPVDKMTKDVAQRASRFDYFNMTPEEIEIKYYRFEPKIVKDILLGKKKQEDIMLSVKETGFLNEIINVLQNKSQKTTAQFKRNIETELGKHFTQKQVDIILEFKKEDIMLGRLLAPDAFGIGGKEQNENLAFFVQLFREEDNIQEFFKKYRIYEGAFGTPEFQDYLEELAKNPSKESVIRLSTLSAYNNSGAVTALNESKKAVELLQALIVDFLEAPDKKINQPSIFERNLMNFKAQIQKYAQQIAAQNPERNDFDAFFRQNIRPLGLETKNIDNPKLLNIKLSYQLKYGEPVKDLGKSLSEYVETQEPSAHIFLEILIKQKAWEQKMKGFNVVDYINKQFEPIEKLIIFKVLHDKGVKRLKKTIASLKEEATLPYLKAMINEPDKLKEFSHLIAIDNQNSKRADFDLEGIEKATLSIDNLLKHITQKSSIPTSASFDLLGISVADLLKYPELQDVAYELHIQQLTKKKADVLTNQKLTFEALSNIFSRKDDLEVKITSNVVILYEKAFQAEDQDFLNSLLDLLDQKMKLKKVNPGIKSIYFSLVNQNLIDEEEFDEAKALQSLESNDPTVTAFAAEKLIKAGKPELIKDKHLEKIATLLDNENVDQFPDAALRYTNLALRILAQVRTKSEAVNKELRSSIKYEEDGNIQLKAAIAYVRNGLELDDRLVKGITKNVSKRGADEQFIKLFKKETGIKLKLQVSCSAVLTD